MTIAAHSKVGLYKLLKLLVAPEWFDTEEDAARRKSRYSDVN